MNIIRNICSHCSAPVVSLGARAAERSVVGARSAIFRGAIEDPDEATVCLDCGHFVRRDRRLGTLAGSTAVDE
jgi:hypothetical protein